MPTVGRMDTEVWLRNPRNWVIEAVECRVPRLVFDIGSIIKWNIDPVRFMELFYPADLPWRLLVVDDYHADEYQSNRGTKPVASWPVWNAGNGSWDSLINTMNFLFDDTSADKRVIVTNLPDARTGLGRRLLVQLAELQEEFEDIKIHMHGLAAFKQAFGNAYGAVDLELRTQAAHKKVFLPNGQLIHVDWASNHLQWINMLGFGVADLQVPRNRCMYNIKAALWAGEHYRKQTRFLSRKPRAANHMNETKPKSVTPYRGAAQDGDRFLCNLCSLQNNCQYFREGAVCAVPGSEPVELANFFNSRDSDTIITGLQTLLQFNARRVESLAADETQKGEYNKELTKLVDSLFDRGIKLAKLVDPKLANPKFAILVPGAAAGAAMPGVAHEKEPREVVREVIIELQGRGMTMDQITPDVLATILGSPNPRQAIEATAIANSS